MGTGVLHNSTFFVCREIIEVKVRLETVAPHGFGLRTVGDASCAQASAEICEQQLLGSFADAGLAASLFG